MMLLCFLLAFLWQRLALRDWMFSFSPESSRNSGIQKRLGLIISSLLEQALLGFDSTQSAWPCKIEPGLSRGIRSMYPRLLHALLYWLPETPANAGRVSLRSISLRTSQTFRIKQLWLKVCKLTYYSWHPAELAQVLVLAFHDYWENQFCHGFEQSSERVERAGFLLVFNTCSLRLQASHLSPVKNWEAGGQQRTDVGFHVPGGIKSCLARIHVNREACSRHALYPMMRLYRIWHH